MPPDVPPVDQPVKARQLRLHAVTLLVRDRARSIRFFVEDLGFSLISGPAAVGASSWVAVAPPDGSAVLSLVESAADPPSSGPVAPLVFLTNDVAAVYGEWTRRGVRFQRPPMMGAWAGASAVFEDPDGHAFMLASADPLTREFDASLRARGERDERARRVAYEQRLAADVQARLFPQARPPLATLDYAGTCRQARHVGGDYYDFLRLRGDRVALVLADVSGKGMPAALLMASLQAHVRAACLDVGGDPARVLSQVNARFWDASPANSYASLLFVEYDDLTRRIRYANCGHPPALLSRRNGRVERLAATTAAIGMFDTWTCETVETSLERGDRLVLYSDGVTEAIDAAGAEYGDARLVETLARDGKEGADALVARIAADVNAFGGADQYDDITVIAAVGR
jgi:catechol 2,3-dioxygenase-like lactoylglutathione lyase family enzyme